MNVLEKIKSGAYETKLSRPIKRKTICLNCALHFNLRKNAEVPNFCEGCGSPIKALWDKSVAQYKEEMIAYHDDIRFLLDIFKTDALIETGLSHHKKGYLALEMAMERGSSEGLHHVLEELESLAELMVE